MHSCCTKIFLKNLHRVSCWKSTSALSHLVNFPGHLLQLQCLQGIGLFVVTLLCFFCNHQKRSQFEWASRKCNQLNPRGWVIVLVVYKSVGLFVDSHPCHYFTSFFEWHACYNFYHKQARDKKEETLIEVLTV